MKKEIQKINAADQLDQITKGFLAIVGQIKKKSLRQKLLLDFLSVMFDATNEILPSPNDKTVWINYSLVQLEAYIEENEDLFSFEIIKPNYG